MNIVKNNIILIAAWLPIFILMSCSTGPQKITIGKDACSFCKMSIMDNRYGAEILTKKGKVYKFDDLHCLLGFMKATTVSSSDIKDIYLVDFEEPHDFIVLNNAYFLRSDQLHTPMGSNTANFKDKGKLKSAATRFNGEEITWKALQKEN
jgi:copper chaperone NosL